MPFLSLNNSWSDLAQYYNKPFNNKPEVPKIKYTAFDDGLIRGGLVNTGISVLRDTGRVSEFFASGKGGLFIIKQVGLQLSNPKLESKNITPTNPRNAVAGVINSVTSALGPTRTYNLGLNTLASVGGTAFGLHFDRAGLLPIIKDDQKYGGNIYNLTAGVAWYNNFGKETRESNLKINSSSSNRLLQYAATIFRLPDEGSIALNSYLGGAQSVYGVYPKTTIRTTSERSSDAINRFLESETYNNDGFNPLTNREIAGLQQAELKDSLESQLNKNEVLPYNKTIASYNIETRIGISTKKKLDSINTINIIDSKTFYDNSKGSDGPKSNAINGITNKNVFNDPSGSNGAFANDLIKFRIEFLNNQQPIISYQNTEGTTVQDINTEVLAFRAYIDDFNDGMSAKWDSYRYMGRGEEFYIYNGFSRDISVAFTMHAHNEKEMAPLYSKLNYLMSTFTPDYNSQLKMRGNIAYLTVGDYIYRQPGVFTDIKLSGFMDGSWEIGLNEKGTPNGQYELPRMLKVGLSFKPIHTFLPRRNYGDKNNGVQSFPAAFITPDRKAYPKGGSTNNAYLNTGGWAPNPKA